MITEEDGSITGDVISGLTVSADGKKLEGATAVNKGKTVFVDMYITKKSAVLFRTADYLSLQAA